MKAGVSRPRRSMSHRVLLIPVLLALATTPGLVGASVAAAPPALAGTTTFVASRPATTTVRLTRPADLVIDGSAQSQQVTVSGTGRLVGFVLVPLAQPVDKPQQSLLLVQVGGCAQPRCKPAPGHLYVEEFGMSTRTLDSSRRQVTLPAGAYTLRAITDGTPVRATLRLAGLSGKTTVNVTKPFPMALRTFSSPPGPAGVDPARSVGGTHEFASDFGLLFQITLREYEPHVRHVAGECMYLDSQPPGGRFSPGCPGAQGAAAMSNVGAPALHYQGLSYGSALTLQHGQWTQGAYAVGVGGPSSLDFVALWLDLGA